MIETKVKVGTGAGALAGVVVWALVSYVPAFRHGVPQPLADAIPFILTAIGNFIGGYLAPHTPRPAPPAALGPGTYGNMNVTSPSGGPVTSTVMTGGHPSPPLTPVQPDKLRAVPPPQEGKP
jgi:hypothetical protein